MKNGPSNSLNFSIFQSARLISKCSISKVSLLCFEILCAEFSHLLWLCFWNSRILRHNILPEKKWAFNTAWPIDFTFYIFHNFWNTHGLMQEGAVLEHQEQESWTCHDKSPWPFRFQALYSVIEVSSIANSIIAKRQRRWIMLWLDWKTRKFV